MFSADTSLPIQSVEYKTHIASDDNQRWANRSPLRDGRDHKMPFAQKDFSPLSQDWNQRPVNDTFGSSGEKKTASRFV